MNHGRLKTREWKTREHRNEGVEIAGVEVAPPEGKGGKRERNDYGKQKFPFSDIVVESSIGLVCPSGLQQPTELMWFRTTLRICVSYALIPAFAFPAETGTHLPIPDGWKAEFASKQNISVKNFSRYNCGRGRDKNSNKSSYKASVTNATGAVR